MTLRAAVRNAAGALRLRAWALAALATPEPPPPPALDAGAWRVFLRRERCALALSARCGAAVAGDPVAAARLARSAAAERRRIASARRLLALLGGWLAERGATGIVLKGGAEALGRAPVDLEDVDVLVSPALAAGAAAALDAAGLRALGPLPATGPGAGQWHLAPRRAPGGVRVEVHVSIPQLEGTDAWAGAAPLAPGLGTLAPAEHLWHVLVHGAVHHPERRAALRELLLAGAAASRCSSAELDMVRSRIGAHPDASALGRLLDLAAALAAGRAPGDGFRASAATQYLLLQLVPGARLPRRVLAAFAASAAALAAGGPGYRTLWGVRLVRDRRGRAGRTALRAGAMAATAPAALAVALLGRRLARGR